MMSEGKLILPKPQLQIDFSHALFLIRQQYLGEALSETISKLDIVEIDRELKSLNKRHQLSLLAQKGLRGELVFAVPSVLSQTPQLVGYYRLLLGFSQKVFYSTPGFSNFRTMEERGTLSTVSKARLDALCNALSETAAELLDGIGIDRISMQLLNDLTLLTLGPQLRGGANVKKGALSNLAVFEVIHRIVRERVVESKPNQITVRNAAERVVKIMFSADPDICVQEQLASKSMRNVIAIEVKGGTDFSNIHNRIGEAEKSHQKAKANGYVECWTILNVDRFDLEMATRESPSTNRFYRLSALEAESGSEYEDFRERIIALLGI